MKKKKLLKRIEELESNLKYERKKYKDLLFEDDKLKIEIRRLEYKIKEDIEHCFFFGLSRGVIEQEVFKHLHPATLSDLENMKYHHEK